MTWLAGILVALSLALDIAGQLLFKTGLNRLAREDGAAIDVDFWVALSRSPCLLAGVMAYAIEIPIWTVVLSLLPLSVAFPLASLSYCGVAAGARFLLGEAVPKRRWLATMLIAVGVAIAAGAAPAGAWPFQ